jgi:hypothetical protein
VRIKPETSNADRLFAALSAFGAPLSGRSPSEFTEPEVFLQIGVEPVRVDITTLNLSLDFSQCWERRTMVDFGDTDTSVLSREDVDIARKTPT